MAFLRYETVKFIDHSHCFLPVTQIRPHIVFQKLLNL